MTDFPVLKTIIERIGDVTVAYEHRGHFVDFFAAEICGETEDGKLLYWRDGESSFPNEEDCYELECAERYISGSVKWDGCAHYYFGGEGIKGYLHLCGCSEAIQLSDTIRAIHNRCGQIMNEAEGNLLDGEFEFQSNDSEEN